MTSKQDCISRFNSDATRRSGYCEGIAEATDHLRQGVGVIVNDFVRDSADILTPGRPGFDPRAAALVERLRTFIDPRHSTPPGQPQPANG
ncbi:hypothetical protein [Engelhardtia mirabilis]|uniref:Uncharacterized protein n=1 Tax=Engelhardtia mirabilis TaxID=2528011 RepID=A0A518BL24_9BACT|nr:hypothetical protein Pla133_27560 [Planctomycetes bacterium Pla133]QDV01994.1 hypothetical protein Pla86_27550 [Planctomycetes bacterium Pla86]